METITKKVIVINIEDLIKAFPLTFTKNTKIVNGSVSDYKQNIKLEVSD